MLNIPQLSRTLHYGVLSLITSLSSDRMTVNNLPTILRLSRISCRFSSALLSIRSQVFRDLFRPRLAVPSKVFQVVFCSLVYNSALFVASSYCSLLLHVVANFFCIFCFSSAGSIVVSSQISSFLTLSKRV